jgi:ubiquinone/menaquinone biosynthesis C-methylase UbiE
MPGVDYDELAPHYDRRYTDAPPSGRGKALLSLARWMKSGLVLEAGCGTGYWLDLLRASVHRCIGLDYSLGMLHKAQGRDAGLDLVLGSAEWVPFIGGLFDLVYCVDAVHHFSDPQGFIRQAAWLLKPGGALAIFGSDPHDRYNSWYAYSYFDGMLASDLKRFPPHPAVMEWMQAAGFERVTSRQVEHIEHTRAGREVLDDLFLQKDSCSQMALMSDAVYQEGLTRLRSEVEQAEQSGERFLYRTILCIDMLVGWKPAQAG